MGDPGSVVACYNGELEYRPDLECREVEEEGGRHERLRGIPMNQRKWAKVMRCNK